MKKTLLFGILTSFIFIHSYAQTIATDFNVDDCSGNSYDLFSNLDQGKIVVLAWVMPCATCIEDPIAAYARTESYASSHPEKIDFIVVDDYADTPCESLTSWVEQYQMLNANVIVNDAVAMSDYGIDGMPKIVLLSGTDHKIYYNENSSMVGFRDALDLALAENETIVGIEEIESNQIVQLNSFPNPANSSLNVTYNLDQASNIKFEIIDVLGAKIQMSQLDGKKEKGAHTANIDLNSLDNGVFFLRISSEESSKTVQFVVSH